MVYGIFIVFCSHSKIFPSPQKEITSLPVFPIPPSTGNHCTTSCLHGFAHSVHLLHCVSTINRLVRCMADCIWLRSLRTTLPGFVYVGARVSVLFAYMTEWCSSLCIYHIYSVSSLADGHVDCFYLLGGVSHAALDVFLQAFLWIYDSVSFQYIPRSEILSHRVILCFSF